MDDDEFRLLMTAPEDNLKKQRARAGVKPPTAAPKTPDMSDDDFVRAMTATAPKAPVREFDMVGGKAMPRSSSTPQARADIITPDELYELGSSPESLKSQLHAQGASEHKNGPGVLGRTFVEPWRRRVADPVGALKDEVGTFAGLVGGGFDKAADSATLGLYTKGRDWLYEQASPQLAQAAKNTDQWMDREHPVASSAASAAGYLAPVGPANMLGRAAAVVGEGAARAVPKLLARPVAGAVTGALGAGSVGAAEAYTKGGSAEEIAETGLRGLKYGAAAGGTIGAAQGVSGRLAEGADRRISQRNVAEFTDGASAAKRDRVVGKGGVKYDRIDSLARRTPELEAAAGDPVKQAPIVQAQIDRAGSQLDDIYDGVVVRPRAITGPLRDVAAQIRSKPHTSEQAAIAETLEREAQHVESTWSQYSKKGRERPIQPESQYTEGTSVGVTPRESTRRVSHEDMRKLGHQDITYDVNGAPYMDRAIGPGEPPRQMTAKAGARPGAAPAAEQGYVDARQARQMITNYGKGLFRGNPNGPAGIPTEIKREVYRRQTEELGKAAEYFKPGISEELGAANAEMSDWLNISDAVGARASRAATPGMTLKGQAHQILDFGLGVLHPGHYLAKKGLEHVGPGAMRGIDRQLSLGKAAIQESNPLIRALESEREQSRRRSDAVRRGNLAKQQIEEEERQRRAQEAFHDAP
jgi:hypothetical protein